MILTCDPLNSLQPTARTLVAGETLFAVGDKARGFFMVRSGRIRLVRFGASGRETVLHLAGPGERFAEASLFAETYHCDAVAETDSVVSCFPKVAALALLAEDTGSALAMVAELGREVMNLRAMLALRDIRSARERVLAYLDMRAGTDGKVIVIAGLLKDLAATIGLTPEALYRTLARLEADRIIRRSDGMIELT